MQTFDFNIGAEVHCTDGQCGRLLKVVVDPHTERVTDLIVEKGFILTTDKVLPVSVVEKATPEAVYLSTTGDQLADCADYREVEFSEPAPEWQETKRYRTGEVAHYAFRYGIALPDPVVPMVRQRVHEGVPSELAVLERGTPVHNVNGEMGKMDHVLVDRESGEISYVIVDRGLLSPSLVVPISKIGKVSEQSVTVKATDEELEEFSSYRVRDDADILAEVRDRLKRASLDFSGAKVTVANGMVQLTGTVPDVKAKRHAEAIASSVDGVLNVENSLHTDAAIVASVTGALASDPRTDLAVIGILNEQGLVTLKGQVDSPEIKEAAEEIAAQQPGVISVVNALEVKPDELTEQLKFRVILGTYFQP